MCCNICGCLITNSLPDLLIRLITRRLLLSQSILILFSQVLRVKCNTSRGTQSSQNERTANHDIPQCLTLWLSCHFSRRIPLRRFVPNAKPWKRSRISRFVEKLSSQTQLSFIMRRSFARMVGAVVPPSPLQAPPPRTARCTKARRNLRQRCCLRCLLASPVSTR